MRAEGYDEQTGKVLVTFEGDDARTLGRALRAAYEVVGPSDLSVIAGLRREHVDALVERLRKVQDLIDETGAGPARVS